jgi:hypothetical protein
MNSNSLEAGVFKLFVFLIGPRTLDNIKEAARSGSIEIEKNTFFFYFDAI